MSRRPYKSVPKAPKRRTLRDSLRSFSDYPAFAEYANQPSIFTSGKSALVDYGEGTPNTEFSTVLACTDTVTLRFSPQYHTSFLLLDFISPVDGSRIETAPGITIWQVFDGKRYKPLPRGSFHSQVELYYINPNLGYEVHSTADDRFIMPFSFRMPPRPVAEPPTPHPNFG